MNPPGLCGKLQTFPAIRGMRGIQTIGKIALLILLLAACSLAGAKCPCASGGGASYNFLGDPTMSMGMDSFDEFARSNVPQSSVGLAPVETAAQSRLTLDLQEKSHVEIMLTREKGELIGQGNMTQANRTEQVGATATLQGSRLAMEMVTGAGILYRFDLAKEGSTVLGDYRRIDPNGKNLSGIADGRWVI